MKPKTQDINERLVKCWHCLAYVYEKEAVLQYVVLARDAGWMSYGLQWLCWFCTYPSEMPLAVHACLVPLKSTVSQIPEETRNKVTSETSE